MLLEARVLESAVTRCGTNDRQGRATLNGTVGEYHFACPLDQWLFSYKGVAAEDVKTVLASGAGDDEIVAWFDKHGTPKARTKSKPGPIQSKPFGHTTILKNENGSRANAPRSGWTRSRPHGLSISRPTIARVSRSSHPARERSRA